MNGVSQPHDSLTRKMAKILLFGRRGEYIHVYTIVLHRFCWCVAGGSRFAMFFWVFKAAMRFFPTHVPPRSDPPDQPASGDFKFRSHYLVALKVFKQRISRGYILDVGITWYDSTIHADLQHLRPWSCAPTRRSWTPASGRVATLSRSCKTQWWWWMRSHGSGGWKTCIVWGIPQVVLSFGQWWMKRHPLSIVP